MPTLGDIMDNIKIVNNVKEWQTENKERHNEYCEKWKNKYLEENGQSYGKSYYQRNKEKYKKYYENRKKKGI